jgi:hypothetical protein
MGTPLVARPYRFLLVSLGLGLGKSSVLRLLDLGCDGATFAHASLEAGHAVADRIRRPDGRFGFWLLTATASY